MSEAQARLKSLRQALKKHHLSGFLIPSHDAFQGEYVPDYAKRLTWLTGFTGSAGLAIVTRKQAAFFTDGRYVLQAKKQLNTDLYSIFNSKDLSPWQWLANHHPNEYPVGFDPWLHSKTQLSMYETLSIAMQPCSNLIDDLWNDQPLAPDSEAQHQPLQFAGMSSREKRKLIAKSLKSQHIDAVLITSPDSLCWLLNMRGNDIPCTPFILCYGILQQSGDVMLFIDEQRLSPALKKALDSGISIAAPSEMEPILLALANKHNHIQYDPNSTPYYFLELLGSTATTLIEKPDPCQLPKACKNQAELEGIRAAHIRDGAALTKFLFWLEHHHKKDSITEMSAADKLKEFRAQGEHFQQLSFESISAFGPHGAIIHYHPAEESDIAIKGNGLYLIDSGGQYLDGTTDVTRTIAIGKITKEQKTRFTQVLKGHIALATATFPVGTTGAQLDCLARQYLWQDYVDYDHGTGHGVGAYLSVHEGPQNISKRLTNVPLESGMILSNEPGYYLNGHYGIRIENLVEVIEKKPGFLGFHTLTLAPLDVRLIDQSLLTPSEIAWITNYHKRLQQSLKKIPY